jgi:hypothetical protein
VPDPSTDGVAQEPCPPRLVRECAHSSVRVRRSRASASLRAAGSGSTTPFLAGAALRPWRQPRALPVSRARWGSHPAQGFGRACRADHDQVRAVAETDDGSTWWLMAAQLRVSSARRLSASSGVSSAEAPRCRR